jgi:hypothetical protein
VQRQPPKFKDALEVLARHGVETIVVGGVAAVLGGAPVSTFDLDVVHRRTAANVALLVAALAELDARYRDPAGRLLRPEAAALEGPDQPRGADQSEGVARVRRRGAWASACSRSLASARAVR